MVSVAELLYIRVLSVASKGILSEVISANAEKVHKLCKLIAYDSRRRGLYHDAKLNAVRNCYTLFFKLSLDFTTHSKGFFYL